MINVSPNINNGIIYYYEMIIGGVAMVFENGMASVLIKKPHAVAEISGGKMHPEIRGEVRFFQTNLGVMVVADVRGLPLMDTRCENPIFAMHIHSGESCEEPETHYNPDNCPHPYHSGDLPPLFSNDGYAFEATLTNRFDIAEIIEKTVVIHSKPDDFKTQPSGDSGEIIACGVIRELA